MRNLKTVITKNLIELLALLAGILIVTFTFVLGVSFVALLVLVCVACLIFMAFEYLVRNWLFVVLIGAGFGLLSLSSCTEKSDIKPCNNTSITLRNGKEVRIITYYQGDVYQSTALRVRGQSMMIDNSKTDSVQFINIGGGRVEMITNDCGFRGDNIVLEY